MLLCWEHCLGLLFQLLVLQVELSAFAHSDQEFYKFNLIMSCDCDKYIIFCIGSAFALPYLPFKEARNCGTILHHIVEAAL